jgi:uncharacterized delta-60 repeat protein/gliding motility-associated-like protein
MKIKFIVSALLIFSFTLLKAQQVFQDTTFSSTSSNRGIKLLGLNNLEVRTAAVDLQGRIIACVAGYNSNTFYIFRLNPDGSPDNSFGPGRTDSIVITSPTVVRVNSLVLQPDGKILLGGFRRSTAGDLDMLVMRLNSDGTRDTDFGIAGFWVKDFNSRADSVNKLALQKSGAIIVAGTSDSMGVQGLPYAQLRVLRLTPGGKEDQVIFQSYASPANTYYSECVKGLDISEDTIYVGADYQSGNYNSILKLLPNGRPAWTTTRIDFTTGGSLQDLVVKRNGDIFICGNDVYDVMYLTKINPNGAVNQSYIFQQYGIHLTTMLLDRDGDFILNGYVGSNYIYSVKSDENGDMDSTFGRSGQLQTYGISNGYRAFNQALFSRDHKLLFVGQDVKVSLPSITKVYLKPVMNIIGNTFVLPKTAENYKADVPSGWNGYTYTWTYTGENILYFTSNGGPTTSIYFTDSATSGNLICKAYSGSVLISYEVQEIIINNKPSNAYQLSKLKCPSAVTNCGIGYIDYFNLNSVVNKNSGCSESGYADYTRSDFNDTLSAGGVYSAHIKIPANGAQYNYVAIWIDYNNDGDFNNTDEFAGEGYSNTDDIHINNIILKNQEGYVGAKRLRVRSQPDSSFLATSSCPVRGEIGETEDYLIMITTQPTLEAPQIITPNDDGLNDFFVIRGVNPAKENKLVIFDRLGTLKFNTSGYENSWNGIDSKGEKLSPGTYFYVFTSEKDVIKGFLEIRY